MRNRPYDNPAYFVIGESFDRESLIIVTSLLPDGFRLSQTIDVEGTLTTLPNGYRAITNATLYAYLDKDGKMLYHGPLIKGVFEPTYWQWKQAFPPQADLQAESSLTEESGIGIEGPNTLLLDGATFYNTIAEVKALPDGTFVELQCKPVQSTSTGYFIMAEDSTSDTLKVYYTRIVNETNRVVEATGTMKTDASERVLCVDSGPGFNPAVDQMGSVLAADNGTVAWAKTFPDDMVLPQDVTGVVTSCFEDNVWGNVCYIQDMSGSSGI